VRSRGSPFRAVGGTGSRETDLGEQAAALPGAQILELTDKGITELRTRTSDVEVAAQMVHDQTWINSRVSAAGQACAYDETPAASAYWAMKRIIRFPRDPTRIGM
jgi:hypothetical protein